MRPGDLTSLEAALDTDPAAERLRDGLPVWRVRWRGANLLRRFLGQPRRDADALLSKALGVLPLPGHACFLMCESDVDMHDLGPGAWQRISPETWKVPEGMEPNWLVERGQLGRIGSFALYVRSEPLPDGGFAREFGSVRTAEQFLEAVAHLGIHVLFEVGPDGTEWIAVLPTTRGTRRSPSGRPLASV